MDPVAPQAEAKRRFADLLDEYERVRSTGELDDQSEATARTWIERVLECFGWDPGDPREIVQERRIGGRDALRARLEGDTEHTRPDYGLLVRDHPVAFLEAKRFSFDFDADSIDAINAAHQIRTYGYAKGLRASYGFSLEQFCVWDTRHFVGHDEDAARARIVFLRRKDFLAEFDTLWDFLGRAAVLRGSILLRVPEARRTPDAKTFDVKFEEQMTVWRLEIAKSILRHGKEYTPDIGNRPEILSAATQRIIDRIVFLRFCEAMGLEESGSLNYLAHHDDGFWAEFMREHVRYRSVYDGILFPASNEDDPTGVEAYLNEWWLKGDVFKTIAADLYRQGYDFSAVPLELLGGIYERFLGKRLVVVGAGVKDEYKPEYQQTKGAVYTPTWVVQRVLDRTLGPLADGRDPEELLKLRVIDPSCGSGSFLLGVFAWLERRIKDWFRAHPGDARLPAWAVPDANDLRLKPAIVRRLIDDCLFGVDVDTEAVEVARMSLALRMLERSAADLGTEHRDLLKGIGRNIKQGNSLVGVDAYGLGFDAQAIAKVRAFDWESDTRGFGAILGAGGFDAVVGNPPYIEVKRYRQWMPEQYEYFKRKPSPYQTAAQGKTDISVPFMEKGVRLLKPGGRLGFIIQNRFFKTDYGDAARRWMLSEELLESIEDFRDVQVFDGRTTYTAIVTLSRQVNESFSYRAYSDLASAHASTPSVEAVYERKKVGEGVWAFDEPDLLALHATLAKRHGVIGMHRQLSIGVGLQTLWGEAYTLRAIKVDEKIVRATGYGNKEQEFERGALRPLCQNRGFYPFRRDNTDAWVIFPYDVKGDTFEEILFPEFKRRFPSCATYLESCRKEIKKAVEIDHGRNRWHLYTRPQNIASQARPKVLFPMTIEDTMAAVDLKGEIYQDNVNVNALQANGSGVDLRAICAVFNSSLFNALAKLKAGLNEGGWRKFNRQFADVVPFPMARLDKPSAAKLAKLSDEIADAQNVLLTTEGEAADQAIRSLLERKWRELDRAVEDLYELSPEERAVAARYPRRIDRVTLLSRQGVPPAASEEDD